MARTTLTVSLLPPPLLLWLLLFLGLGGVSCFNCYQADITITGQWSQAVIQNIKPTDSSTFSTTVYVDPEQDFKGISLRIRNDYQQDTAWFDFDDPCIRNEFRHDNYWHEIKATVQRINLQKKILVFEVHAGMCLMMCKRDLRFDDIWSLDVVAYGPSKWRLTPPPAHCNVHKTRDPRQSTMDECTDPPSLPTAPTPTPRTTTTTTETTHTNEGSTPRTPPPRSSECAEAGEATLQKIAAGGVVMSLVLAVAAVVMTMLVVKDINTNAGLIRGHVVVPAGRFN
ncbi:uncharacterized protein LOC126981824 isoform X2 [Eriocheir sinensis]|uniref:uncharacterized protein LOC126981824 isoform X2 n=1 Tax=Eriocheir sinensis TaxID=95602 RepID=UPI0021C7374D|nr:uncharacterized protein LOC126981824 isoform X2 [Eriocheir sinensis]